MTLGEGKKKVLMLMDEYSSGGEITEDEDIAAKMTAFFDIGQKEVAKIKKIRSTLKTELRGEGGRLSMPMRFQAVESIWVNGEECTARFKWRGDTLVIPEGLRGMLEIDYFAIPETIPDDAPDSYEFELPEDACNALPYFVASQQLITDLIVDYAGLYAIYQAMVGTLSTDAPGGVTMRNSFWR